MKYLPTNVSSYVEDTLEKFLVESNETFMIEYSSQSLKNKELYAYI